jgi:hypothetical protein
MWRATMWRAMSIRTARAQARYSKRTVSIAGTGTGAEGSKLVNGRSPDAWDLLPNRIQLSV